MQQRMSLLLDLFPRDSFYLAGLNLVQTAYDLLLPGGIHILINGCVQTGDQISSQFRPFVLRQCQGFLQQFTGFLGHNQNYMPRCNLVFAFEYPRAMAVNWTKLARKMAQAARAGVIIEKKRLQEILAERQKRSAPSSQ